MRPGKRWTQALTSSWRRGPKLAGTAGGGPRCPSCRWWPTWPLPRRCWPPAASPTAGVLRPRWPWAPPGRCSGPGSWLRPRLWFLPRSPRRSSKAAGRTPSAAGCPTSPGKRRGRRSIRPAPSALPSSTSGGAGKASLRPTPAPGRLIARPWRTAICHRTRCGPARRSTSSRRYPRRPISSARFAAQAEEALARAAGRLPVGSGRLAVGARVNLELGGFDREPYLAAGAERQLCDGRGCDVHQGGWLSFEVDPDPVSEHGQAGYLRGPGVAGAAGLRELAADHHGGRADGDEHVAVQALVGDDEGPAAGQSHPGAVGPAGVEVEADKFRDVLGGGLAGDLSRGALLDDAPGFEDDELVSEHERFERVVRDQQAWPGEICQVFPEFGLHVKAGSRVQRRQGLVQ